MESKTPAIVLHHLKYTDSSLVATIYTRSHGRKSFLVQGVYRARSKFPATYFQPLTLLDLEISVNPRRELQRIRELTLHVPLNSVPFEITKSAIALFLAEILYRTLREEEPNPVMFDFLSNAIQFFDLADEGAANFHLWFLINFSKHLGFYPDNNYSSSHPVFDPVNGRFYAPMLVQPSERELQNGIWLHKFMTATLEEAGILRLNHSIRNSLLMLLVEYYQVHLGGLGEIKSLPVLQSIFGE